MPCLNSLSSLSEASFAAEHDIALRGAKTLGWAQLLADIEATRQLVAASPGGNWALYEEDGYRFVVGLLALLAEGASVYLPADNHRATAASLQAECEGLLGSFEGLDLPAVVLGDTAAARPALSLSGSIVVYTSGTTGTAKRIEKTLAVLDAEIAVLESLWGDSLGDAVVLGTVSHQHLYGLLFRVLWPLCCGRRFVAQRYPDVRSLVAASQRTATAWVCSPAHLHRVEADIDLDAARSSTRAVFSSGGLLSHEAARQLQVGMQQLPIEVLGSSETGGIAWRQQHVVNALWQPLPEVEVRQGADTALELRSPFMPEAGWYSASDSVQLQDNGCFALGGRLDRIVKVEGTRVALGGIETALLELDWVQEAGAQLLQRQRQSLGAVLVLSAAGIEHYCQQGQGAFVLALRQHLSLTLPAVAVPRVYRITAELPRNSQGKLLNADILALLEDRRLPAQLGVERTSGGCELQLHVDSKAIYLEGHFSDLPVVPGVVQLYWAHQLAQRWLGTRGKVAAMRKIKFSRLITPPARLTLTLNYDKTRHRLFFSFQSAAGDKHSSGYLLLEGGS